MSKKDAGSPTNSPDSMRAWTQGQPGDSARTLEDKEALRTALVHCGSNLNRQEAMKLIAEAFRMAAPQPAGNNAPAPGKAAPR